MSYFKLRKVDFSLSRVNVFRYLPIGIEHSHIFLKISDMCLWTRRMHFWQSRQKFFAESAVIFHKFLISFLKCFSVHVECSFDHPPGNFSLKIGKSFAQCRKIIMNLVFFSEINFCSKMFPSAHRMQFWQLRRKLLAQSPNNILKFWCFKKRLKNFLWNRRNEVCQENTNFCLILYLMYWEGASWLSWVPMFFLNFSAITF